MYVDARGLDTYYFGFTSYLTIHFLDLFNPDIKNQSNSSLGNYFDTDDLSFGVYAEMFFVFYDPRPTEVDRVPAFFDNIICIALLLANSKIKKE